METKHTLDIPKEHQEKFLELKAVIAEHKKVISDAKNAAFKAATDAKRAMYRKMDARDEFWNFIEMIFPETIGFDCSYSEDEMSINVGNPKTEDDDDEPPSFGDMMRQMLGGD